MVALHLKIYLILFICECIPLHSKLQLLCAGDWEVAVHKIFWHSACFRTLFYTEGGKGVIYKLNSISPQHSKIGVNSVSVFL